MKAKEAIEILQKNPDLELVVCECNKYEDNIPLIPVSSIELFSEEDSEEDSFLINFETQEQLNKKLIQLRTEFKFMKNVKYDIDKILNGEKDIESYSEFLYLQTDQLESKLDNLKIELDIPDNKWDEDEE